MEKNEIIKKPHSLTLDNRQKIALTGIENVLNSTENAINLASTQGGLSILGKNLKIEKFNIDELTLVVSGQIDILRYEQLKSPILKRIFK